MTSRTVTAMFSSREQAEQAGQALMRELGLDRSTIRTSPASGVTDAGYDAKRPYEEKGFFASLKDLFVPDEDRYAYAEGMRRGSVLLSASLDDNQVDRASDVLEHAWRAGPGRAGSELAQVRLERLRLVGAQHRPQQRDARVLGQHAGGDRYRRRRRRGRVRNRRAGSRPASGPGRDDQGHAGTSGGRQAPGRRRPGQGALLRGRASGRGAGDAASRRACTSTVIRWTAPRPRPTWPPSRSVPSRLAPPARRRW